MIKTRCQLHPVPTLPPWVMQTFEPHKNLYIKKTHQMYHTSQNTLWPWDVNQVWTTNCGCAVNCKHAPHEQITSLLKHMTIWITRWKTAKSSFLFVFFPYNFVLVQQERLVTSSGKSWFKSYYYYGLVSAVTHACCFNTIKYFVLPNTFDYTSDRKEWLTCSIISHIKTRDLSALPIHICIWI